LKLIYDIDKFEIDKPVVLTQGTFDGVHFGHKKILKSIASQAREIGGVSVLLTFYPHPRLVLYPDDNDLKMLSTIEEKVQKVDALGINYMVILPFTKELSRLRADEFVRDILVEKLKVSKLVIGYDHRFGRNREGGIKEMRHYSTVFNFEIEEIPAQDIEESTVSSTKIRKALLNGEVDLAATYLGSGYQLGGLVEAGVQRGTTIGYPTANVRVSSSYKLIPKNGVYAVWVFVDENKYAGMLNIGYNPTFDDKNWSIEVHIFDFNQNIYHKKINIQFVLRTRDEKTFDDLNALINQLKEDEKKIRKILEVE
jgi:riboflavin kinase/FMN adenylyltransferase